MKSMKHAALPLVLALTLTGLAASITGPVEAQVNSQSTSAATIYGRRCASCHGRDGRADTPQGKLRAARDLTDPQWQSDVSDERIFNSINNGRGKMPSYGKKVSEADINSLVTYVRGLKK
jgi:cytochrome c6